MERTTTSPEFNPTRIRTVMPCVRNARFGVALHQFLHAQGGVAGAHGVVLVGDGRAEQRHDPVAHHLVHGPLVAMDRLHHALEDGIEEPARLLGVAISQQLHRALEIGKQDGDLLALTF